ncbi:MAG: RrF2 family transcriptional regulator [Acidimicrobiales bacterium]
MNLTLTKRGDYVVRAALALARAYPSGGYRKIREVVAEMGVPATFASQILADLVHADLATSKAGKGGGYRLHRGPEDISVLEVVEAGEGILRADRCALGEGPCRWESVCPLHETWGAATAALRSVLAQTSLSELAATDRTIESGDYAMPPDAHRHGFPAVPVDDLVLVEGPVGAVGAWVDRGESSFPAMVAHAYEEADEIRHRLDPGGLAWSSGGPIAVSLAGDDSGTPQRPRSGTPDPGGLEDPDRVTVPLYWEASAPVGAALSSRFEGRLTVRSLDDQRTEVRVEGRMRPPDAGGERSAVDPALSERLVQATVRSFLRQLARGAEADIDARRNRGRRNPSR